MAGCDSRNLTFNSGSGKISRGALLEISKVAGENPVTFAIEVLKDKAGKATTTLTVTYSVKDKKTGTVTQKQITTLPENSVQLRLVGADKKQVTISGPKKGKAAVIAG